MNIWSIFGNIWIAFYTRFSDRPETNMTMPVDLYYVPGSAPCRIVLLVAAALNIELNLIDIDLQRGEHLTPSFLKLNPQHTVPTIVDNGFSLWESRAISRYLVHRYGGDTTLYPRDVQSRGLVDQRLDFDLGTLYPRFAAYFYPIIFEDSTPDKALLAKLEEALGFLDEFLEDHEYAVGHDVTLADLSLVATVSTIEAAGINLEPYANVQRWYKLVKITAPKYEEANGEHVRKFKQMIDKKLRTEL